VVWEGKPGPIFGDGESEIFFYNGTTTTMISHNSGVLYEDYPKLTDSGYVVWTGRPNDPPIAYEEVFPYEVFLYDGTSTLQLTDNDYPDSPHHIPDINEDGHVVWQGCPGTTGNNCDTVYEIFLYDGVSTIQLTDDEYPNVYPKINDQGKVVWSRCEGDSTYDCRFAEREILLYDGTTTIQLTDNDTDDSGHSITDSGYVSWVGMSNGRPEIFLYDGTSTIQVTDNNFDMSWSLNENGHAVWLYSPDGLDSEVFLYNGTSTVQLTDNDYNDKYPSINDNGYVMWFGDTTDVYGLYDIFIYDGLSITQISDGDFSGSLYYTKPNAYGQVAWSHAPGPDEPSEVYLYDGSDNIRISYNSWGDGGPVLNDNGYIAWEGKYERSAWPPW